MGEDSGATAVTREELVSIVQQLVSQGLKVHLPEHWTVDATSVRQERKGEEPTTDNGDLASRPSPETLNASPVAESEVTSEVPTSHPKPSGGGTGDEEGLPGRVTAVEGRQPQGDVHPPQDKLQSLSSIPEEKSPLSPSSVNAAGPQPAGPSSTAAGSPELSPTTSPHQEATVPDGAVKKTRRVAINAEYADRVDDSEPQVLPTVSDDIVPQLEPSAADLPETSKSTASVTRDDHETHPSPSAGGAVDLNPWAAAITGKLSECQGGMQYLQRCIKQLEARLKSVEKGIQTLGAQQGTMARTLSSRAKATSGGSKELQSLIDLQGINKSFKSFKNITVPDTSKESEAIKRQVEQFHAMADELSQSFAEASKESRGHLEELSDRISRGLEELAAADQYLMSCIGGAAQNSEAQGRELTAHIKHTNAGLQAIKEWVMTELGNIRGQEKALEIKHTQSSAMMDSLRSKLADFNDKLRVHTHDEIYEFIDMQIRNLAGQVEVLLRSTLHESLHNKSGQTGRQLAALARSHEKLSSNFEELKILVGRGQMPIARGKPTRGATQAERTQHSSASFPKGGGFFPPIAPHNKPPANVHTASQDGKAKDDVESLGVYTRSEQVSLASGVSDTLTVAGVVPAALTDEESVSTIMAVVSKDGSLPGRLEQPDVGVSQASRQQSQPPDFQGWST